MKRLLVVFLVSLGVRANASDLNCEFTIRDGNKNVVKKFVHSMSYERSSATTSTTGAYSTRRSSEQFLVNNKQGQLASWVTISWWYDETSPSIDIGAFFYEGLHTSEYSEVQIRGTGAIHHKHFFVAGKGGKIFCELQ